MSNSVLIQFLGHRVNHFQRFGGDIHLPFLEFEFCYWHLPFSFFVSFLSVSRTCCFCLMLWLLFTVGVCVYENLNILIWFCFIDVFINILWTSLLACNFSKLFVGHRCGGAKPILLFRCRIFGTRGTCIMGLTHTPTNCCIQFL